MIGSILNSSSNELNGIESYSNALFGDSYRIIPLDEIEDLSDGSFPFNPSEGHIILKKKNV